MIYRIFCAAILLFSVCTGLSAQLTQEARFEILRTVIAEQAAARINMPFGADGFELTEAGGFDQEKIDKAIKKNGQSIETGKIVFITEISFSDNKIEVELDGGGKNKKSIWERIEVGMGSGGGPIKGDDSIRKAKGSKIVLKFDKKAPPDLTPDQLRKLLDPVLNFNKQTFLKTGIESLPVEFQEAVKAKEAKIGMDAGTVIMALGRPNNRVRETVDGADHVTWIYYGRGSRVTFVTFEGDVVVKVTEHGMTGSEKQ